MSNNQIPAIQSYYFYEYSDFRDGDNYLNLIQLIAHADKFVEDKNLSKEEIVSIQKNKELCTYFFEDSWSSRNGVVCFLIEEFSAEEQVIIYYTKLIELAKANNLELIISRIKETILFYQKYQSQIKELQEKDMGWEEELEKIEILESEYYSSFTHDATQIIANRMINKPNSFCRDEKGNEIDVHFSGKLKTFSDKGIIRRESTIVDGKILGECVDYYLNGSKHKVYMYTGPFREETIKSWYSDGQIEFEKTDEYTRYWYKNGQLSMENKNGKVVRWDEFGKEL